MDVVWKEKQFNILLATVNSRSSVVTIFVLTNIQKKGETQVSVIHSRLISKAHSKYRRIQAFLRQFIMIYNPNFMQ